MFRSKSEKSASRVLEEQLYERVYAEISQGIKRNGLWMKALTDSVGDETKAKSLYVKYRVQSLLDEGILAEETSIKTENQLKIEKNVSGENGKLYIPDGGGLITALKLSFVILLILAFFVF